MAVVFVPEEEGTEEEEEVFCWTPRSGVGKCNTDVVMAVVECLDPVVEPLEADKFFAKLLQEK